MASNERARARRSAAVFAALVTITALASGCSGSPSADDRQAHPLTMDHRICVTFDSATSWPNVEFNHYLGLWYSVTPTQTADTTQYCDARSEALTARFTTPGGVAVSAYALNDLSETSLAVTYDGTTVTKSNEDLPPGGNSYQIFLPTGETLWFGRHIDSADNKEFFVKLTTPK
jgi:hypothetical protein